MPVEEVDAGGFPSRPEANSWRVGGWLLIMAAFAIGFINFPMRVVGWQFDYLPGDGIDNRLNNFVLEHGYHYLSGQASSFWDVPAFYPVPGMMACSDAHIGMLPFYAALRGVGLSPEAAFQGWFLVPFALNFASAAWALRRLGAGWVGVASGAYVFAFGIPLAGQLIHAQLYPRFFVPPAVVCGWEFLRSPRANRLAACLGCVVCQVYVSIYIGYFLVLLLAFGFFFTALRFRSQLPWNELLTPGRRVWSMRLLMSLTAALAVYPLGIAHTRKSASGEKGFTRSIAPGQQAWLRPAEVAAVFPYLTEPNSTWEQEQQLFTGLFAMLATGVGVVMAIGRVNIGSRRAPLVIAACSTLTLGLLVTVSFGIWPYQLVTLMPGGGMIRAVGRVVLVMLFPISVTIAAIVDSIVCWAGRFGRAWAVAAAIVMAGLVISEQSLVSTDGAQASLWKPMRYSRYAVESRQDELKEMIRRHPSPTLVYVFRSFARDDPNGAVLEIVVMRASQDLGIPCVNGYSGYSPIGWRYFGNRGELMNWLEPFQLPPDRLNGLVLIGEPSAMP